MCISATQDYTYFTHSMYFFNHIIHKKKFKAIFLLYQFMCTWGSNLYINNISYKWLIHYINNITYKWLIHYINNITYKCLIHNEHVSGTDVAHKLTLSWYKTFSCSLTKVSWTLNIHCNILYKNSHLNTPQTSARKTINLESTTHKINSQWLNISYI